MMNLFVVLIPMLLLSAVFVELAVIRMGLPSDDAEPAAERKDSLGLAVAIEDDRWVVQAEKIAPREIARGSVAAIEELRATLADVGARFP